MRDNIIEHIKDNIMNFFIIVTLVDVAIFVSGIILAPDAKLGYDTYILPVLIGFLGIIPGLIMYSKKELTIKQVIVRNILQLILTEAIILTFLVGPSIFSSEENRAGVIAICISVAVIYAAVIVIRYFLDLKTAAKITEALKVYQEEEGNNA